MLHTQAALRILAEGSDAKRELHEAIARRHLAILRPREPVFRRRWLRAMALKRLEYRDVEGARRLLDAALAEWPQESALLVARGAVEEVIASRPIGPLRTTASIGSRAMLEWRQAASAQRRRFVEARRYYERALEASPEQGEARLRLARTLLVTDRADQALEQLEALLAGDPGSDVAYLAYLLRGAERQRRGDGASAEADFRAALALRPLAQSARLALAAALHARGATREAGALVQEGLRARREALGAPLDPWWLYPQARAGQVQDELTRLRHMAVVP